MTRPGDGPAGHAAALPAPAPDGSPAGGLRLDTSARTIWAIALPIIFAEINETIVEVTDAAFLARFGTVELGAVGLAAAIYEVVVFFSFGLADSVQIVAARRAGQERARGVGDAFFHGAVLVLLTSAALFLILEFGAPFVTAWVVQSDAVRAAVNDFIAVAAFSVFFHCLNMAYSALFVGIGKPRVLIGATAILAVTNLLLDYALIFGHFGLPRLGIRGAALGSLAAELAAFAFLTTHALRNPEVRRLKLFTPRPLDWSLARVMLRISWPASLERLVETGRWFLFFLIVERMGENPLAVTNIVHGLYGIFLLPIDAVSEAVCTLTSNLIGQERSGRIGDVVRRAGKSAALVALPLVGLALLLPGVPIALFDPDPALAGSAAATLRVAAVAVLVIAPAEMVFSAVAGSGDTRATLLIEIVLSVCVLLVAYAAGVALGLPLEAVWAAEIVGGGVCLLLSAAWLRSERWKRLTV